MKFNDVIPVMMTLYHEQISILPWNDKNLQGQPRLLLLTNWGV